MQADSRQRTCSGSRSFQHIFLSVCQAVELAKHPFLIPSCRIKVLHQTRVMQAECAQCSDRAQALWAPKSPHISSLMVVSVAFFFQSSFPGARQQGCLHSYMLQAVQSTRVCRAGLCLVSPILVSIASMACKISTLNCCGAFEQRGCGRAESGEAPVRIHILRATRRGKSSF